MTHILIVDDESQIRGSVRRILEDSDHTVSEVGSGAEALLWLKNNQADLLVLDIIMPGMSGIELCQILRANPFHRQLPIIFLTAKSRPSDIAAGLDAGGDDYITKPVEVIELPARIRALLRRSGGGALDVQSDQIVVGDLSLSTAKFELTINGNVIILSGTEHRLLFTLMSHPNQPLSIEKLLQDVWEYPAGVGDPSLVYAHIKNLRQKIEPNGSDDPIYIRNVRGQGYLVSA